MTAAVLVPSAMVLGVDIDVVQNCDIRVTRVDPASSGTLEIELSDLSDMGSGSGSEFKVALDLLGQVNPSSQGGTPAVYSVTFGYVPYGGSPADHTITIRPTPPGNQGDPYGDPVRLTLKWLKDGSNHVRANLYDQEEAEQIFDADIDYDVAPKFDFEKPLVEMAQKGASTANFRIIFEGRSISFTLTEISATGRANPAEAPVHAAAPITDGCDLLAAASLSVLNGPPVMRSPYAWRWRAFGP
jgi:hypothetical protein